MIDDQNIDHLSRLPPELIHTIFNELEGRDRALTAPVSKKFVPFQQLRLYRNVSLNSYDQLDKFCKTAKTHPGLMNNVVKLKVNIEPTPALDDDLDSNPFIEEEDPLVPTSNGVILLFSTLANTATVEIRGSSRIAGVILSPEVSTQHLPKLSDLGLASTLSDFDDPFHPAFYSGLVNYTELVDFSLSVWRNHQSIRLSTKPLPEFYPSPTNIFSVSLYGPLSSSVSSVKALLTSFSYLPMLDLADFSPTSQMYDLLDGLDCPKALGFLALKRFDTDGPPSQGSIVDRLTKFTSLDRLVLAGNTAPVSSEFYSALQAIPLKVLIFELGADVDLKKLAKLISGPHKHASLQKIRFDNVIAKRGTTFEEMDWEVYTGPDGDGFGPYPDWKLPRWTDKFEPDKLKKFLKVAEKEGIKVEGSALEALKIDEEFTGELDFLYSYGEVPWEE
ncbi:hypothetical protein JCM5350_000521 [Sporobolomyces pararoseus]